MKVLQYVISAIGIVGSIFIGGIFALNGLFQLIGAVNREAMTLNLVFGFGVLFIGCFVIPFLAKKLFGVKSEKSASDGQSDSGGLSSLGYDRKVAKENGETFKEASMKLDEIFK